MPTASALREASGLSTPRLVFFALTLAIPTCFVYRHSFDGPFIFDDEPSIRDNAAMGSWWGFWPAAFDLPVTSLTSRPVTAFSFVLNFQAGYQVGGYHAVNFALHLMSGFLLWGVIRRTCLAPNVNRAFAPMAPWLATAIALVWLVHPLQSEAVVYIVQRTTLQMGFFMMATFYAAIRAWDSPRPMLWKSIAVLCCALGMGSKEDIVAAPILLVMYDATFFAPSWRETFRCRKGFYLALAGTWILLAACVLLAPTNHVVGFGQKVSLTAGEYLLTQARAIGRYLRLSFWPQPLMLVYDWPKVTHWQDVAPQGLLILGLLGITAWGVVRRRWWGWLGAWFFLILAPTSSIMPIATEYVAERRMYLPLLAIVSLVILAGVTALRYLAKRAPSTASPLQAGTAAIMIVVVTGLGYLCSQRIRDYNSPLAIWSDTAIKAPHHALVQFNLGSALLRAGYSQEAQEPLRLAAEYAPTQPRVFLYLSNIYRQLKQYDLAEKYAREALQHGDQIDNARLNLAIILSMAGNADEAIRLSQEELNARPDSAMAHHNYGVVLMLQRRFDEAEVQFRKALRLEPSNARLYFNRAQNIFSQHQRPDGSVDPVAIDRAIEYCLAGLRLFPNSREGREKLADFLLAKGEASRALAEYESLSKRWPDYAPLAEKIARAKAAVGKP